MHKINRKPKYDMMKLFVPGRLCLFGEHTDWAGHYRTMNADIAPGAAIVTGIEQGIYVCEPEVEYRKDTTLGVLRERIAQYSYPDTGDGFGVYITAGKSNKPNIDESFAIIFNGCYFSFDGNGFRPVASEPRSEIEYTAELLDAFEVNGVTYHDVLHIQQVESRALSSRGPVELYYAKHYGMIQYTIPYGITYFRLPAE